MFTAARLKLTLWYLLIIMAVSLVFSGIIHHEVLDEVERGVRMQQAREERRAPGTPLLPPNMIVLSEFNQTILDEATNRVQLSLLLINVGILIAAGLLGYFLAGKTLRPIEEMVEEQKRFISDASHELRTPLTAMKTEIEVTMRDKTLGVSEAKALLKSNLEEVNKMQSLVNYLLSLGRYQNSQAVSPVFSSLDIRLPVGSAILKVTPLANEKKIVIANDLKRVTIRGNSEMLSELFTIILDNAIKYSPSKGMVSIALKKTLTSAIISISDNGVGITKKDLPFIFNRFFRSDTSRNRSSTNGYGLGLAIAKTIVEQHAGKIIVKSQLGRGTTFNIELPLSKVALRTTR